ncbi:hypothetical protein CASFOL_019902 [Castilleja foliolosa]|uniref:CLAVATA3/ESR (CLE)-related protein n=1 Tax=Castilleja foliolosa TaxID=1961234 RepID=A0ABD3CZB7_9LAMI
MAQSAIKSSVAILIVIITFSMFMMSSSGARILSEHELAVTSSANLLMRKMGFDEKMLEYYRTRGRSMEEGYNVERLSPGGPDPKHH